MTALPAAVTLHRLRAGHNGGLLPFSISIFNSETKAHDVCQCGQTLQRQCFSNPVFGSKSRIQHVEHKCKEEVILELQEISELIGLPLDDVYTLITNPNYKNCTELSIIWCPTCHQCYKHSSKTVNTFLGIPYTSTLVQTQL